MKVVDYSFDEERARKVTISLLSKDAIIFRKLIPEIEKLDSKSLENLFSGELKYQYNIKDQNALKKLLMKFDNFFHLIHSWYKYDKYYKYLEELWIKYPSIEDLKSYIKEKGLSERLKSYSINYTQWPEDIKEGFKKCINQTKGTKVMDLKKQFIENFSHVYSTVKELKLLKNKLKEEKEKFETQNVRSENEIIAESKKMQEKFGNKEIKEYRSRLNEYMSLSESPKNNYDILQDDLSLNIKNIKIFIDNIKTTQQKIINLIMDIIMNIIWEKRKKISLIYGVVYFFVIGVFGFIFMNFTFKSILFYITVAGNFFACIFNIYNIIKRRKIVPELNPILNDAFKEEEKIQQEIDRLIEQLIERIKQEPKFELDKNIYRMYTEIFGD